MISNSGISGTAKGGRAMWREKCIGGSKKRLRMLKAAAEIKDDRQRQENAK
jgi:hypothetical protein